MEKEVTWDPQVPPKNVPYGSIEQARAFMKEKASQDAVAKKKQQIIDKYQLHKITPSRAQSKIFPKNPPPKGVIFPFLPVPESAGRYVSIKTDKAGQIGMVRVDQKKPKFPSWLIELSDKEMMAIMEIKRSLSKDNPNKEEVIEDLYYYCYVELGLEIDELEVREIVKKLVVGDKSAFPLFMWLMANSSGAAYAAKKRNSGVGDVQEGSTDRRISEEKKKRESAPPVPPPTNVKGPYSQREKLFYTGLLLFEMYTTLATLENLYYGPQIPEPPKKIMQRAKEKGFTVENLGTKKLGFAEWDRPLPPMPKVSPYVAKTPFVMSRWYITKPNADEYGRRRTLNQLMPIHMMIHPPKKVKGLIKVTENQLRIQKALEYLASQGHVLAMIPEIHLIIHLSDNLVYLLDLLTMKDTNTKPPRKVYPNTEKIWIEREAKKLYRPHGLPPQIARMTNAIKYTDGINLRKICKYVQDQHWTYICSLKRQFRDIAWKRMNVDRIPQGSLMDNFVYAFCTYLPLHSHLPPTHDFPSVPW